MLIEGLPLWLAQTNAWLVAPDGPGGEAVLIDAPPDPASIVKRLEHHGLQLVALFNTHGHIDHIGGVGSLVHGLEGGDDIDVRIHDDDRHMLLDPLGTSGMFGAYLQDLDLRPPELIHGLDDGEQVRGAGMTFTALHTPGHTRGSVCFTLEIDGEPPILFSGDHLFAGSIGRTDLPGRFVRSAHGVDGREDPPDGRRHRRAPGPRQHDHRRAGADHEPVPDRAPATRQPLGLTCFSTGPPRSTCRSAGSRTRPV